MTRAEKLLSKMKSLEDINVEDKHVDRLFVFVEEVKDALREMAWEAWKERHNLSGSLCPLEIEKPIFDEWYEKQIKP